MLVFSMESERSSVDNIRKRELEMGVEKAVFGKSKKNMCSPLKSTQWEGIKFRQDLEMLENVCEELQDLKGEKIKCVKHVRIVNEKANSLKEELERIKQEK